MMSCFNVKLSLGKTSLLTFPLSPSSTTMDCSQIYDSRNSDDTYKDITDYLMKCGPLTLADAEYGKDFYSKSDEDHRGRTFLNQRDHSTFQTIVFGEIMPPSTGTQINAKGNHFQTKPVRPFLYIL
jgi:hypothetical protein